MHRILALIALSAALAACMPKTPNVPPKRLVGVIIDNHENARAYQRGLEKAPIVIEQLVEGYITRLIAILDPSDLPASIGPVRSVRTYFIDASSPLLSAIFHVGGSPEALDQLYDDGAPVSFNAISTLDPLFDTDADSPAPHNRFLSGGAITSILKTIPETPFVDPGFRYGSFVPDETATGVTINFYSPVHNVQYRYAQESKTYEKTNRGSVRPPSPANIVILETDVKVVGPLGRLGIVMDGSGSALLFRDGGLVRGSWSKAGPESFFTLRSGSGETLMFQKGQIWMIVLDSLERVSWR